MADATLNERFRRYLLAGERVRWSGRPKQGLALSGSDALLIPFSLMWGGFAIFWNAGVWLMPARSVGDGPGWFFKLWGIPFLLIGLYVIAGRFFHDAWLRRRMFYAVTDQRILILRGSQIVSFDIHRLPRLELSEHRDGSGTLIFDEVNGVIWNRSASFGTWVPALGDSKRFFRVRDPRQVYEFIRRQA